MIRARRTVSFLSIFALSAALAGCGDDDDDGPVGPVGGSSGAAGAAGGGGSAGGPAGGGGGGAGGAGAVGYDAISYDLRGSFDWARQRLVVSELIAVKLADPKASTSVELDAVVEVKRVHAGGTDLPYVVDPAARKLRVDLSSLGQGEGERSFSVDYEAPPSHALLPYQGRDGDPVAARVVSTDSEPDDGVNWLVAHHHP
ncbi:MAG TPA: hypothetical protein VFS00_31600, partial [Polyangiaceae bacterium]|nr:hypothetical protein [Polyangiaceae bacterium]